jgi:hypothetical protein
MLGEIEGIKLVLGLCDDVGFIVVAFIGVIEEGVKG